MDSSKMTPVSRDDLLEQVMTVVTELRGPGGALLVGLDLEELGFDSMKKLELLAVLEHRLGVSLTEDLLPEFKTPVRIADIVAELLDSPSLRKY